MAKNINGEPQKGQIKELETPEKIVLLLKRSLSGAEAGLEIVENKARAATLGLELEQLREKVEAAGAGSIDEAGLQELRKAVNEFGLKVGRAQRGEAEPVEELPKSDTSVASAVEPKQPEGTEIKEVETAEEAVSVMLHDAKEFLPHLREAAPEETKGLEEALRTFEDVLNDLQKTRASADPASLEKEMAELESQVGDWIEQQFNQVAAKVNEASSPKPEVSEVSSGGVKKDKKQSERAKAVASFSGAGKDNDVRLFIEALKKNGGSTLEGDTQKFTTQTEEFERKKGKTREGKKKFVQAFNRELKKLLIDHPEIDLAQLSAEVAALEVQREEKKKQVAALKTAEQKADSKEAEEKKAAAKFAKATAAKTGSAPARNAVRALMSRGEEAKPEVEETAPAAPVTPEPAPIEATTPAGEMAPAPAPSPAVAASEAAPAPASVAAVNGSVDEGPKSEWEKELLSIPQAAAPEDLETISNTVAAFARKLNHNELQKEVRGLVAFIAKLGKKGTAATEDDKKRAIEGFNTTLQTILAKYPGINLGELKTDIEIALSKTKTAEGKTTVRERAQAWEREEKNKVAAEKLREAIALFLDPEGEAKAVEEFWKKTGLDFETLLREDKRVLAFIFSEKKLSEDRRVDFMAALRRGMDHRGAKAERISPERQGEVTAFLKDNPTTRPGDFKIVLEALTAYAAENKLDLKAGVRQLRNKAMHFSKVRKHHRPTQEERSEVVEDFTKILERIVLRQPIDLVKLKTHLDAARAAAPEPEKERIKGTKEKDEVTFSEPLTLERAKAAVVEFNKRFPELKIHATIASKKSEIDKVAVGAYCRVALAYADKGLDINDRLVDGKIRKEVKRQLKKYSEQEKQNRRAARRDVTKPTVRNLARATPAPEPLVQSEAAPAILANGGHDEEAVAAPAGAEALPAEPAPAGDIIPPGTFGPEALASGTQLGPDEVDVNLTDEEEEPQPPAQAPATPMVQPAVRPAPRVEAPAPPTAPPAAPPAPAPRPPEPAPRPAPRPPEATPTPAPAPRPPETHPATAVAAQRVETIPAQLSAPRVERGNEVDEAQDLEQRYDNTVRRLDSFRAKYFSGNFGSELLEHFGATISELENLLYTIMLNGAGQPADPKIAKRILGVINGHMLPLEGQAKDLTATLEERRQKTKSKIAAQTPPKKGVISKLFGGF